MKHLSLVSYFLISPVVQVEYEDLQREKLKKVIEEMTEENKQIKTSKIKDKEKIKKLEGLLQKVHQQVEPLVIIRIIYIFKAMSRIVHMGHIRRNCE